MPKRNPLYTSKAWRDLRARILERDGHQCQVRLPVCTGWATQVDHLVPYAVDPDLALVASNLRACCPECNRHLGGKLGASRSRRKSRRTAAGQADGFGGW